MTKYPYTMSFIILLIALGLADSTHLSLSDGLVSGRVTVLMDPLVHLNLEELL